VTLLWEVGGVRDVNILIAAVLHDTLEDTVKQGSDEDFALQAEIRQEFGEEVLSLVKAVTDDKSLPKEERKKRQIEHAASTPPKAKLIKLADKISNVTDIAANPPKDWSLERRKEYLNWAKAVVDAAQADSPNLVARFEQVYRDGMRQLQDQHAAGI
jgi:guanosine-3',5'-bis(diphosphate) 3'-pyrophosphohydrolase